AGEQPLEPSDAEPEVTESDELEVREGSSRGNVQRAMKWIPVTALTLSLFCSCAAQPRTSASAQSDSNAAFEVIPMKYASAAETAKLLTELGLGIERQPGAAPCRFVADSRTNSMLVEAEPADLARIKTAIARLDVQVK